jgi:hypothetical protein
MTALHYKSFSSRHYEVLVDRLSGTHLVRDRRTDKTTLRWVCHEGLEEYRKLKATYRESRPAFDEYCATYSYH